MPQCYAQPFGRAGFGLRPQPLRPHCWLELWLPIIGFRSRRSLPLARLRFVWLSLLISLVAPLRLVVVALARGPPPRSAGLTPCVSAYASTALLRPYGALPPTGAIRARCARGLHCVPPESLQRACGGLPSLRGCCGAVALTPRKAGNLPPQSIVLGAGYALAAHVRYAHQLNMQNKC